MKMKVVKRMSFAAAHYLPGYDGKCANLHGHTWIVEVALFGPIQKESGMVIDFTVLKGIMKELIEEKFDHKLLNDTIELPTAEHIAEYIKEYLDLRLKKPPYIEFVRVWESEDSYAEASHD